MGIIAAIGVDMISCFQHDSIWKLVVLRMLYQKLDTRLLALNIE
jgi:hypothetical protein